MLAARAARLVDAAWKAKSVMRANRAMPTVSSMRYRRRCPWSIKSLSIPCHGLAQKVVRNDRPLRARLRLQDLLVPRLRRCLSRRRRAFRMVTWAFPMFAIRRRRFELSRFLMSTWICLNVPKSETNLACSLNFQVKPVLHRSRPQKASLVVEQAERVGQAARAMRSICRS